MEENFHKKTSQREASNTGTTNLIIIQHSLHLHNTSRFNNLHSLSQLNNNSQHTQSRFKIIQKQRRIHEEEGRKEITRSNRVRIVS